MPLRLHTEIRADKMYGILFSGTPFSGFAVRVLAPNWAEESS
jgi:hypothetical protein